MSLRLRLALTVLAVALPLGVAAAWAQGALERREEVRRLHEFIAARMVDGRAAAEADPERFPPQPVRGAPGTEPRGPRSGPGRPGDRPSGPPGPGPEPRGRGGPGFGGPGFGGGGPRADSAAEGPQREPGAQAPREPGPPTILFAYDPEFRSANASAPEFPTGLRAALEAGARRAETIQRDRGEARLVAAQRMDWDTGPAAIVVASRPALRQGWITPAQLATGGAFSAALTLVVFLAAGPLVRRVRRLTEAVRGAERLGYASEVQVRGGDELAELGAAFNAASERIREQVSDLEARSASLREFVADTTHDVMTPMTVLQGHLGKLRADEGGSPSEQRRGWIDGAVEEAQYMTSLLQNLTARARLEADALPLAVAAVDLGELVLRVVARHRPLGEVRGIGVEGAVPEHPLEVRADRTLVEQAVGNLVHNAVRYGAEGGHVALLLDAEPGGGFLLRVVDDGEGLPADEMRRWTERRFRADAARSRAPEGQGLGLAIASEVAERHGWSLELRASEYGGVEARLAADSGGA